MVVAAPAVTFAGRTVGVQQSGGATRFPCLVARVTGTPGAVLVAAFFTRCPCVHIVLAMRVDFSGRAGIHYPLAKTTRITRVVASRGPIPTGVLATHLVLHGPTWWCTDRVRPAFPILEFLAIV